MNAFKTLCQQMKYDPFKKRNRKINRISVAVAMMIFPSACAIVYAQGKEPFTENGVWFWFPVFVALCLGSIAVLLPWRTLGRWLWRWWNGREFERKPLPVGGAVALNQDPLRYSDSAQEAPVGIFGSFSWKDKDGVVHGGPFRGQTLDDVANPLAGLTAEQIAARVNRGEPVRVKDAFEALGLKQPTLDDAIISDPVRIKAEMLRQHMEGRQQILRDIVEGFGEGATP